MPQVYRGDDHDTVIRKFAENIARHNPDRYRIILGKSDEEATTEALLPDIRLYESAAVPSLAIEVETADSVTAEQAQSRWLPIAACGALEIALPKGYAGRARTLCRRFGIKARLIEY